MNKIKEERMKSVKQVKIFNNLLTKQTLLLLIWNKIELFGSAHLAKLLTELSTDSEIEELNNKIFNQEIK